MGRIRATSARGPAFPDSGLTATGDTVTLRDANGQIGLPPELGRLLGAPRIPAVQGGMRTLPIASS